MKSFVIILALVSAAFSNTILTTNYRTDLDIKTGKSFTQEYVSTFEIMNGRFVHSTQEITSVYVVISQVGNATIGGNTIMSVPCRSEAGNEYLYIFDITNGRIYTVFSDGSRFVQFDIGSTSTTE